MSTPVEQLSFKPTGASTARNLGDWTGDTINVKNFGAVGNGVADDTSAIQAAVDAAFGPITAPHGPTNKTSNKPLFFPAGNYLISKPIVFYGVNGGLIHGAGMGTTTVVNTNTATTFVGDGSITGEVLTITAVTSGTLYVGSIISGTGVTAGTVIAQILTGSGGVGTYSVINTAATGSITVSATSASVFYCNGVGYTTFREIYLKCTTNGVCFDWDWHQTSGSPQGNTVCFWEQVGFEGDASGAIGLRIGKSQYQADQSTIMDCYFAGGTHGAAGIRVENLNAITNSIYGGNIIGWTKGIYVPAGSMDVMSGVGFQVNTQDIVIEGGGLTGCVVSACSTEGADFFNCTNAAISFTLIGCIQRGAASSTNFASSYGSLVLIGCWSEAGPIGNNNQTTAELTVINCKKGAPVYPTFQPELTLSSSVFSGVIVGWDARARVYADLPVNPYVGMTAHISDANSATWGATVGSSVGTNKAMVRYNGTNWTVVGV